MRHTRRTGDETFLGYAVKSVPFTYPQTGAVRHVENFVAALGASSYTYSVATWSDSAQDWRGQNVRAFASFGGVPEVYPADTGTASAGARSACADRVLCLAVSHK